MLIQDYTKLIEGFTVVKILLTVLAFFLTRFLYNIFLKPFLQLRAYKAIPGTLITYKIGSKTAWKYSNLKEKSIELNSEIPFLVTEHNTLLLKHPDLKVMASNLFQTPRITLIDHQFAAESIKNHDNYLHFLRDTMLGRRYTRYAMIFSTGNDWKRQRKIISKAFDFESMRKILPIVQELAKELFENETFTNGKEPLALQPIFLRYTWEALSRSFFGDNLKGYTVHGEPFAHGLNTFMKGQFEIFMNSEYQIFGEKAALWNSNLRDQVKKTQEIGKMVERMIENISGKIKRGEMKNPDGRKGILELLLQSSDDNNDTLTTLELIGNFFSFSFAGTDSSSNTSSNLLYCLAIYPHAKKKALEDIRSHWDGESPLTLEVLNKMEYLHALILETLRVMTPVPGALLRIVKKDHMVGNIPLKKGYILQALFSPTFFSPKCIRDPDLFQPERWIKGNEAYQQLQDTFIFNPFSFGPRNCIGQHFATTQIKVAMCYFLTRFDFNLPPDFKLSPMVVRATSEPEEYVKMFIKPKETNLAE